MSFRINTNVVAMNAFRNLSNTGNDISKSVTRLSTGMRINDASDDPAGLIASERFRAQIGGIDQAMRNSQDALNYSRTAEGALDEVNRLLREARTLAVAYSGTVDSAQLQANQNQINNILASIDRVSTNTQFGTRKLLDGSAGVQANITNTNVVSQLSLGGNIGSQAVQQNGDIAIDVTQVATRANLAGTNGITAASQAAYLATAVGAGNAGTFSVNGRSFTVEATQTWGEVVNMINNASDQTGVVADVRYAGGDGFIDLRSTSYGANANIELVDSGSVLRSVPGNAQASGQNAIATVTVGALNGVTFTGGQSGADGLTLTDGSGNMVRLTEQGNAVAAGVVGRAIVGSSSFQIGAFAGQTTSLSLGNFGSSSLGIGSIDVTSSNGARNAMELIDSAITRVSQQRGDVGSFMRNILESNIRSLGVARENLSATESAIREIDVAEEMTNYSKLQILQQSGLSVLAQANQAPQGVLSLLR